MASSVAVVVAVAAAAAFLSPCFVSRAATMSSSQTPRDDEPSIPIRSSRVAGEELIADRSPELKDLWLSRTT